MYKAFNLENKQEIILLDPAWAGQLATLRALDKREVLVCPGCLQPVRLRAGRTRRWHFAHKHLENCPFEQASPELLAARAVLYNWLLTKFDPGELTIEKAIPDAGLPRPIDCWVEYEGRKFAYWIITVRLAPDLRERLKASISQSGAQAHWILHIGMLRPQKYQQNRLHLTTTEREFIEVSTYDEPHQERCSEPAGSLSYLDPDRETITTYRGLCRVHAPQLYRGHTQRSRLDEMMVSFQTGEPIHPGESRLIEQHHREQVERKRVLEHAQATLRRASSILEGADERRGGGNDDPRSSPLPVRPQTQPEVGRCIFCGQETSDWWYFNRATGECKCRACYRAGRA